MTIRKVVLLFSLFALLVGAQTPAAKSEQKAPAFMGPCSNLTCEIENDWLRNNALIYGLANAMPDQCRIVVMSTSFEPA